MPVALPRTLTGVSRKRFTPSCWSLLLFARARRAIAPALAVPLQPRLQPAAARLELQPEPPLVLVALGVPRPEPAHEHAESAATRASRQGRRGRRHPTGRIRHPRQEAMRGGTRGPARRRHKPVCSAAASGLERWGAVSVGRPRSGMRSAASRRRQAAPGRAPVGVADADGGEVVGAGWAVDGRHPVVEVPVAHRRREEPAEDAHVRPVHHRLRQRGGGGGGLARSSLRRPAAGRRPWRVLSRLSGRPLAPGHALQQLIKHFTALNLWSP